MAAAAAGGALHQGCCSCVGYGTHSIDVSAVKCVHSFSARGLLWILLTVLAPISPSCPASARIWAYLHLTICRTGAAAHTAAGADFSGVTLRMKLLTE